MLVLQKPNKLYPRVILIRAGAYDPAVNHVADIMCMLYYLVQVKYNYQVIKLINQKTFVDNSNFDEFLGRLVQN